MFDVFFHFSSFSFNFIFYKKSKLISFQLGLNHQKNLRIKLKKYKILHSSSIVMYEKINSEALHNEKPTLFRVILNNYCI